MGGKVRILIVPFGKEHVEDAQLIGSEAFSGEAWSREAFYAELKSEYSLAFAAVDSETKKTVGYIMARCVYGDASVDNFAVSPEYRNLGVGKRLLSEAVLAAAKNGAQHAALEVRSSNKAAIKLYESAGFKTAGMRKNFYLKPVEDAYLMTMEFSR